MKIFQVDAFTDKLFQGNPAAVIPLTEWLPDALMQNIAMENNLAETAFLVPKAEGYAIRWFTPTVEVELCGHATLASGHVVFEYMGFPGPTVVFYSLKSGELKVSREGNKLTLDFPNNDPKPVDPLPVIFEGLRIPPRALFKGAFDYMVVLDNRREIEALDPDFKILAKAPGRGVVVTARGHKSDRGRPGGGGSQGGRSDGDRSEGNGSQGFGSEGARSQGEEADFVSRCFYSQSGIDEDPVTGSAHTMMVPYWARQLGKTRLSAIQLSQRRGYLDCELAGDRVLMSGYAKTFLTGEVHI